MTAAVPEAPGAASGGFDEVRRLNAQAFALRHQHTEAALALCRQADALAQALGDAHGRAVALLRTALCEYILGHDPDVYEARLRHSLAQLRELDDRAGEAEALNLLGNVHGARAEHERALAVHRQALELRRTLNDLPAQAASLNNLGIAYRDLSRPGQALDCLRQSLAIGERIDDRRATAYARLNIALLHLGQDDLDPALEQLDRALSEVVLTDDRALECSILTGLARARARRGDHAGAQGHLQQAQALAQATGNVGDGARVQLALGEVEQALGRLPAAEHHLRAALAAVRQAHDRSIEPRTLRLLAHNLALQGQAAPAMALIDQALALPQTRGMAQEAADLHHLGAELQEARGDLGAALGHLRSHQALLRPQQRAQRDLNRELAAALEAARRAERQKDVALAELAAQTEQLRQLTREDALTGVANRRWLDLQLPLEQERSRRFGHPLAVAMIDVDRFKAINDGLTHGVGDEVLRVVARLLFDACRRSDLVARYGGEEFVVLMAETGLADALRSAEKLRQLVAGHDWATVHPGLPPLPAVTVSIGVAAWHPDDGPGNDPLAAADRQLYLAKQAGRNRVCG